MGDRMFNVLVLGGLALVGCGGSGGAQGRDDHHQASDAGSGGVGDAGSAADAYDTDVYTDATGTVNPCAVFPCEF